MPEESDAGTEANKPVLELKEVPEDAFRDNTSQFGFNLNIRFGDELYRIICPVCGRSTFECRESFESDAIDGDNGRELFIRQKLANVICSYCEISITKMQNGNGHDKESDNVSGNTPNPRIKQDGKIASVYFHDIFCPLCGSKVFHQFSGGALLVCEKGHTIGVRMIKRILH